MASIYALKPGQLFPVPAEDKETRCKMCLEVASPDDAAEPGTGMRLGPLYLYGNPITVDDDEDGGGGLKKEDVEVYCAHYFCLLFSSGLEQRGEDEDVGLKGFLPADVLKEWRRGQRLKCSSSGCGQRYATVGCSHKSCRKTFHLPCAVKSGALLQYCDEFSLFCLEHRPKQSILKAKGFDPKAEQQTCGICYDDIADVTDFNKAIWSPCCNKWFDKSCVQRFADSSGYFFKCPMCNNKDEFEHEMKLHGIFVPEKDAAWETLEGSTAAASGNGDNNDESGSNGNGDAFQALLERYDNCDAPTCICPEGRKKDEDYTEWEIILCRYCGSQGIHVKCGGLPLKTGMVKWRCDFCKEAVKNLPPKTIHHFAPVKTKQHKSSDKSLLNQILAKTKIVVKIAGGQQQQQPSPSTISFKVHSKTTPTKKAQAAAAAAVIPKGRGARAAAAAAAAKAAAAAGGSPSSNWKLDYVLSASLLPVGKKHAEVPDRVKVRGSPPSAFTNHNSSHAQGLEPASVANSDATVANRSLSDATIALEPVNKSSSTAATSLPSPNRIKILANKSPEKKIRQMATDWAKSPEKKCRKRTTTEWTKSPEKKCHKIDIDSVRKELTKSPQRKSNSSGGKFKNQSAPINQRSILQYFSTK